MRAKRKAERARKERRRRKRNNAEDGWPVRAEIKKNGPV
jgi:hypothetical protein